MSFYDKFSPDSMTLKDFSYWTVLLRKKQITLGDAVIILKREVASIGDVLPEEMSEFPKVVAWYEEKCCTVFKPEKFNYVAAMMKDNFVHFHAFPRYSNEIAYNNNTWKDNFWPKPINLVDVPIDDALLTVLLSDMKDYE